MSWAVNPTLLVIATVGPALGQASARAFLWHSDFSYSDLVSASQVVVVGRVRSVSPVGPHIDAPDDQGYRGPWQLVKVAADSETVVKGDVFANALEFFYYTSLGAVMGDWNNLRVGERCVFFLTRVNGVLRAVRDFWRSSIDVGTGRPTVLSAGSVKERIATLLLTPGDGLDPRRFAATIVRAVDVADQLLGECRANALLENLLTYPNGDVQDAVRRQLQLRPQDGCRGK